MNYINKTRKMRGLSQRQLAALAKVSFRTIQLLESGDHDARLSTLSSVAESLGYAPHTVLNRIANIFVQPVESIDMISERLLTEGEGQWPALLFEFVDAFRAHKDACYVELPPNQGLSGKMRALVAATVETLCAEFRMVAPSWCAGIPPLDIPWFVAGTENLKALALMESPVWFRRRNIFVLGNFLARA